jgi:hypothetical protein
MRPLVLVIGIIGTLALVTAMVQSMLVTRNSRNWISSSVGYAVRSYSRFLLRFLRSYAARDRWLTGTAPTTLLLQLTAYGILFILTLGLATWGSTELDMWRSLYQSGSTFTTLGIVERMDGTAAVISFLAAGLGLVVVAIFIGYLMAIYGMYANRESVMARLTTYAGEPAWGPELLARASVIGSPIASSPDIDPLLEWVSQLRLDQDMYPVLADFRSTSSSRHWVTSLLAVMDAVALRLAMDLSGDVPGDIQFLTQSATTMACINRQSDASWNVEWQFLSVVRGRSSGAIELSLTDEEWSSGWSEMVAAGITSPIAEPTVRDRFERLRSLYVTNATQLADRFYAVRAPWSGERTPPTPIVWPILAGVTSRSNDTQS